MAFYILLSPEKNPEKIVPFDSDKSTAIPFNLKTNTNISLDSETDPDISLIFEKSIVEAIRSDGYQPLSNPKNYCLTCDCGIYSPKDPLSRFLELSSAKLLLDNGYLKCKTCKKNIGYIPRELTSFRDINIQR